MQFVDGAPSTRYSEGNVCCLVLEERRVQVGLKIVRRGASGARRVRIHGMRMNGGCCLAGRVFKGIEGPGGIGHTTDEESGE